MSSERSLVDKLPFWHFHDELMIYADGSLGCGYEINGLDISCEEEEKVNEYSRKIENLFLSATEGLRFQVYYKLTNDIDNIVSDHQEIVEKAPDVYKTIADARINHLKNAHKRGQDYFIPKIFVFLRSKPLVYKKKKLFEKETLFRSATKGQFYKHEKNFRREIKQVESSLRHIGLSPKKLDQKRWFNLCFDYLNLSRSECIGRANLRNSSKAFQPSFSSQLCLTDLTINSDHLKIGEKLFKTITLKTLPDGFTYASMIEELCKLDFHLWITQTSRILDQEKEKEALQLKRRLANAMAFGSKMSDIESESKLEQIEGLIAELVEGTQKLILMDLTVVIWADDLDELNEKTDEVLKAYRDMNQAEGVVETLACFDVFMNSIPGSCSGFRYQKVKSSNLAHLSPFYSDWLGNSEPVCLIPTRENALFSFAPFSKKFPNYNGLIFGSSGGGKSFTIVQLMLMFYGQNPTPKLYWIDNGKSCETLLDVLDGEFIDFTLESGLCLNPFALDPDESSPTQEKVGLTLAAIELILKDEDAKGLPKRIKALLEEAIIKTYENAGIKNPTLSHLKSLLDSHEDEEMRRYGQILYSWTGNRTYGKILDGNTNVKLNKDIVAIEVQSLNDYPELKSVVLLLLTSFMKKEAMRELDRPTLIIVDEAERLFKSEMAKQLVITFYRTLRKYNSGIFCVSQNYLDFMQDEEVRNALLPNTTNIFVLRQKRIDWKKFQSVFDLNEAQVEAIKSIEIEKGVSSEMVLFQDEKMAVLKLVPEPLSYWISTSDANDKIKIATVKEKFNKLKTIDVLKKIAFGDKEVL